MFASRTRNQVKEPAESKAKRGAAPPARRDAPEHNSLWQALAIRTAMVRPKLTVSQANDPYEQEADRVAEQVMRRPESRLQRVCASPTLQTKSDGNGGGTQKTPPLTSDAANLINSPAQGEPLGATVQQRIEPVLNADLSTVRVHRNLSAQKAAEQLGAKAFTSGRDIFLGAKQSPGDVHLLAHEATHVVQQSGQGKNASKAIQRDGASYHEGAVRIIWSDDYAEVYRRIVAAVDTSRNFSGIPRASMWQPFHTPAIQFHRRHSSRHLRDLNEGDRVEIHVSGFYDNVRPGVKSRFSGKRRTLASLLA